MLSEFKEEDGMEEQKGDGVGGKRDGSFSGMDGGDEVFTFCGFG
jgi:hypothetical protein